MAARAAASSARCVSRASSAFFSPAVFIAFGTVRHSARTASRAAAMMSRRFLGSAGFSAFLFSSAALTGFGGFAGFGGLVKLKDAVLLGIVRKVLALEVLHDDIRRAVLLEIVAQGDDVALADKLGESPGFLKETGLAYLKGIALYLRRREYGQ